MPERCWRQATDTGWSGAVAGHSPAAGRDRILRMARALIRTMRIVLCALALAAAAPRPADACIRAGEVDRLLGWSADGKYALYVLATAKGGVDHAEILPTSYAGYVYTITPDDDAAGMIVSRVKVGTCAAFGDDTSAVVEKARGKLTETSIRELKTVAAMKFGTVDEAGREAGKEASKAPRPTAAFTGKKRYDVHDVELTAGDQKTVMPLPVYCVGSCLADENWQKWSIRVDGVHHLPGGTVLYDLALDNVCNGGTMRRVITRTPPDVKVPKHRCTGAGE